MLATPEFVQTRMIGRRVRFVSRASEAHVAIAPFASTKPYEASVEEVASEILLASELNDSTFENLDFLFLPGGAAIAFDQQQLAARWIAQAARPDEPATLELLFRGDRVLWRPGRALMQGSHERMPEVFAALVDFAFYEGQLRDLERETPEKLENATADVPLTHAVTEVDLLRQAHVNQVTEWAGRARIRFTSIQPRLEKASIGLAPVSRRLVTELCVQSETAERLRAVDDQLEVIEDLYELANDRLTEFAYFSREYRIEIWILAALIIEAVVMIFEFL